MASREVEGQPLDSSNPDAVNDGKEEGSMSLLEDIYGAEASAAISLNSALVAIQEFYQAYKIIKLAIDGVQDERDIAIYAIQKVAKVERKSIKDLSDDSQMAVRKTAKDQKLAAIDAINGVRSSAIKAIRGLWSDAIAAINAAKDAVPTTRPGGPQDINDQGYD